VGVQKKPGKLDDVAIRLPRNLPWNGAERVLPVSRNWSVFRPSALPPRQITLISVLSGCRDERRFFSALSTNSSS
jgi:hypothetical protein